MPGSSPDLDPPSFGRHSDVAPRSPSGNDLVRRLEEAVATADLGGDRAAAAAARLALGRELLRLEDPECREVLEDAGTAFEELGDGAAVVEIDALLRRAAIAIEECPRSFHGVRRR